MEDTFNILLSGDLNAEDILPTLIKSVCDNTYRKVHARIICRNWNYQDFETDTLKVEFISYNPSSFSKKSFCPSVNARTEYMAQIQDWDRCLLMGWDNLVIGNIDELYDVQFSGNQCFSAIDGNKYLGEINWGGTTLHGVLPESLLKTEKIFLMGANIVDLKKSKELGLFDNLEQKIKSVNSQDHMAFFAIFSGHVKRVSDKFNRLLHGQTKQIQEDDRLIHYNGINKPWNCYEMSDEWRTRKTTWTELKEVKADTQVLFFVSCPRSGSTLLNRLLNCCYTEYGVKVKSNGETGLWKRIFSLKDDLIKLARGDSPKKRSYEEFLPYYYNGHVADLKTVFRNLTLSMVSGSEGDTVAFKEVNLGISDPMEIIQLRVFLKHTFTNQFKIIYLKRDKLPIQSSMKKKVSQGWWSLNRVNNVGVQQDILNSSKEIDMTINYSDLLTYEKFSFFLQKLNLRIEKSDYEKVVSVKQ